MIYKKNMQKRMNKYKTIILIIIIIIKLIIQRIKTKNKTRNAFLKILVKEKHSFLNNLMRIIKLLQKKKQDYAVILQRI